MIKLRGARTHNLQNIDIELPRDQLIVITGISGSGKSSLAFDTIYAEGQRRYVESLSTYARQFLSLMEKPDVDHISGLSPAISIEQKATSHNPRSTVGTVTEIHDYLRLLFARCGTPKCPTHLKPLDAQTVSQMVDQVLALPDGTKLMLLASVIHERKGEHLRILQELQAEGFVRARINGEVFELDEAPSLDLRKKHTIEAVVDRFRVRADMTLRLAESFETALRIANGRAVVAFIDRTNKKDLLFSAKFACPHCGYSLDELEPRLFSFNSPIGACSSCDGLGHNAFIDPNKVVRQPELSLADGAIKGWDQRNQYTYRILQALAQHYDFALTLPFKRLSKRCQDVVLNGSGDTKIEFQTEDHHGNTILRRLSFEGVLANMERRYRETESAGVREELAKFFTNRLCPDCDGTRLNISARHTFILAKNLPEIAKMPIKQAYAFFMRFKLPGRRGKIAEKIVKEIQQRLQFLVNVGLDYLTLERSADTLSGGEAQRIRLASQIGAGLVGVMYVLDEPSIGLHQRDNQRLLSTLTYLRDLGNTIIVVEHDQEAMETADHIVDIGPGAGAHGGRIVAQGNLKQICDTAESLTGKYLNGTLTISPPTTLTAMDKNRQLHIIGAHGNNLKSINVALPVGLFTCITGVSGSGKSTLINDTLYGHASAELNHAMTEPAPCKEIKGLNFFDKAINIDQSPIGRTPRSNPATYAGFFTTIRELFAATPEARSRGYTPGRFSFNVKGGRCEACRGDGVIKVAMHFLPDIYVHCDVCNGKRYNRETLSINYKGKTIHEILMMTVEQAREFFDAVPVLVRKLQTLLDVGLSYIQCGQNATTLSGGEAQRVKLARELSKRDTGRTLYILDEPTTGLHFHDIKQLLVVLHRLRDHGNTIIVIEHNLDVIKTADWVVDLGPEGGDLGGEIVATGTPKDIACNPSSYTGQFLQSYFK